MGRWVVVLMEPESLLQNWLDLELGGGLIQAPNPGLHEVSDQSLIFMFL